MQPVTEALRHLPWARRQWLPGAVALSATAAMAALVAGEPLVAVGLVLGLAAVLTMIRWPETVVPVVIFVLYANVAVVAVRFHGVPPVVGMLVPAPLAGLLVYQVVFRRRPLVITPTLPFLFLFLLLQLASALGSRDPGFAVGAVKTSLLEGLAIYLVVTNVIRSWATLRRAVWALLAAGALMGGLSAFQQATGTTHNDYGGFAQVSAGKGIGVAADPGAARQRRLCGPIGEQNRYAQIMLMLLPLGVFSVAGGSPRKKALGWTATVLTAAGCALTFSRGAAVSFILVIFVMAAMRMIKWRHLAGIALFTGLLLMALPRYRERITSIPSAANLLARHGTAADVPDGAVRGRATAMLAAARVWAAHPILGVGPGMFNSYSRDYGKTGGFRALEGTREAHNLYLEIASEQGVLGLFAFLAAVTVSLRCLARARRAAAERPEMAAMAVGFILALAGYLATGLFLHFSYVRYFWLMIALADAAAWIILRSASADSRPAVAATGC